ncbi:unnamed protein product [Peronospora destructor]|uniref:Auto-transporter adhesin head GIN domain-containing protein n=1 Tax=Peronospora destructor TaxID=86335 RepID=A0AAV0UE32_9STRA|nr:unnamed protein product [Peronospora destructor]
MNLLALFLVATAIASRVTAEFTVTSRPTEAITSSMKNVKFVKQWTLTAATTAKTIDSIDLDLVGRVYVSYKSGLPSGVLGYVNVSGDSQTVVDAVTVSNDDADDTDDKDDDDDTKDNTGELNVRIGSSTLITLSGYLLTEIILASAGIVTDVKSQQSAQIVIEEGVLLTNGKTAELQVGASGSSAVYVSAVGTDVSVSQLQFDTAGTASLQFNVKSMSVTDEAQFESKGSARIALLASSVKAAKLELDAENTGTICTSAKEVTATTYEGKAATHISMPNATNKQGSIGLLACDEAKVPAREAACVSSTCDESSTPGITTGSGATTSIMITPRTTNNDDNASDDTSAALTPQLSAFATTAFVVAMASLL